MHKRLITFLFAGIAFLFTASSAQAQYDFQNEKLNNCRDDDCCEPDPYGGIRGKIDLAPAYAHVDLLKSGHSIHKMDLGGIKGDMYYRIWSGLVIKPSFLWAHGNNKERLFSGGFGIGFCCPFKQCFCFTPVVGINWGNLKAEKVDFFIPFYHPVTRELIMMIELQGQEKFRSVSPYVGFEFSYTFYPSWRIVTSYQYSWSRTHTTIMKTMKYKERSKGSNYNAMIEYDLTKQWSINFGGAYNCSLSKEKHGLRAYGFKLGLGYWF